MFDQWNNFLWLDHNVPLNKDVIYTNTGCRKYTNNDIGGLAITIEIDHDRP